MKNHLYIHIPFCARKCAYCNFYSVPRDRAPVFPYMDALSGQIKGLSGKFRTIYIGGGTPSVINLKLLERLVGSLNARAEDACEFTVEANPESMTSDVLKVFLAGGVNRLSIGVQSTVDKKLKSLGRIHDAAKAKDAVLSAHKIGFKNISIDLIFGVWGETTESWKRDLEEALKLPAKHVSCYELTYEKGTPLFASVENKSIEPVDDDTSSRMYELAIDSLSMRGLEQYEVSNFAMKGYESRHNLNYWDNGPYLGLGASAFSYIGGARSRNLSSVAEYIKLYNSGKPLIDFSEELPPINSAKETAAVKIRTREGIDFGWFRQKTGYDFLELEKKVVEELLGMGLIEHKTENSVFIGIALTRKGFLHCDTVSSTLL